MKQKIVFILGIFIISFFSCTNNKENSSLNLTEVRIGVHNNAGGISLAAAAVEKGFFTKYGIKPVFTIVESGPAEMEAMRADDRQLDIGYIGAGVAWNAVDGEGNGVSFVFFDILSNAEMLIAKKNIFFDRNGNGKYDYDEIYQGLRGKTVYFEIGTTPGSWFKDLINLINEEKPESEKLWISSDVSSYLLDYTPPNSDERNKVTVVNTLNSRLPDGMAATGGMDIVVGFSPVTSMIMNTNPDAEKIATTVGNFPVEKAFPSTWVASDIWLQENPELAQNFIYALYEAAIWRSDNLNQSIRKGEILAQVQEGVYDADGLIALSKPDYQEWFLSPTARGYIQMWALYEKAKKDVPSGHQIKSFKEAFKDSLMLNAIRTIK